VLSYKYRSRFTTTKHAIVTKIAPVCHLNELLNVSLLQDDHVDRGLCRLKGIACLLLIEVPLVPIPQVRSPPLPAVSIDRFDCIDWSQQIIKCLGPSYRGINVLGLKVSLKNRKMRDSVVGPNDGLIVEPHGRIDVSAIKIIDPIEGHCDLTPTREIPMMVD